MSNVKFSNFGKTLLASGYFTIFTMILGLMQSLSGFIGYVFPEYGSLLFNIRYVFTAFGILGLVLALLILITAKKLTLVDNHPNLHNFYQKMLASFILAIVAMVYPTIQSLILLLFKYNTILSIYIGIAISGILSIVRIIITVSGWSFFLKYSTARGFNPNVIKGSNLIKVGYILSIFSSIIAFLSLLWSFLMLYLGFPYSLIMQIFSYFIIFGAILLDLSVPILLIVGRLKVGKSIQNFTLESSAEPTLGDSPFDRAIKQTAPKEGNFCSNCGASVLTSAVFCPHCGNSL